MMAIPLRYNLRSLIVRRVSTAMTVGGIALVTAVFVLVMAMVAGLAAAIQDSGSPDNLIAMRKSATTEAESFVSSDQFDALKFLPPIRRDGKGNPLVSPELTVQTLLDRIGGAQENIIFRGVEPIALPVHTTVHIIKGRMFNPSLNEVIVGQALEGRYSGTTLGSTLRFGRGTWTVVGIFAAEGSSFESEIWGELHRVQQSSQRGSYFSSVRMKLMDGTNTKALIKRLADDPRINLQGMTEPEYYLDQSRVADQLRTLVLVMAVIMAAGAIFGAMNTMYAAVSSRTQEIGTLRALGFRPGAVMASFLFEAVMLALAAGAIGVLLATPINGFSSRFGNFVTFSTLAFSFRITLTIVIEALTFAATMGLLGGWLPARQAMRMSVVVALRRS